ncbi:MAG: sugar MFS transporter [Pyrinomonadaceae bacterium]
MSGDKRLLVLKLLLHFIYFLSGVAAVLIGQILPILANRYELDDLQAGFFFPAQFAGSLTGSFVSHRLGIRNKYMSATIFGAAAMASGSLMMNMDSYLVGLCGFYVLGIGIGLTLPSINMMIIEVAPERTASALSILNFCWGIGAIVCKPFVDAVSSSSHIGITTYVLAVPLFCAAGVLRLVIGSKKTPRVNRSEQGSSKVNVPIWRMPLAWAIAFFNFVHVGFESGMGGWLTTYTGRMPGPPIVPGLSPTVLYFSLFVIGRGVAPLLFRYLNENKMLFLGLTIVLLGITTVLSADGMIILSIGSAISGFGTSWIFPTNVARFSKTFGPEANRRATPLFMAGTLGAASVTWLIGFLSSRSGDLRYGMLVLGVSVVILLVLQCALAMRGAASQLSKRV